MRSEVFWATCCHNGEDKWSLWQSYRLVRCHLWMRIPPCAWSLIEVVGDWADIAQEEIYRMIAATVIVAQCVSIFFKLLRKYAKCVFMDLSCFSLYATLGMREVVVQRSSDVFHSTVKRYSTYIVTGGVFYRRFGLLVQQENGRYFSLYLVFYTGLKRL